MSERGDASAEPIGVIMRRPTLNDLPAVPNLPVPLTVRRARIGEAGALAALLGRAFEGEHWDAAGTELELFRDESVKATLVATAEERLVATASLQIPAEVSEYGCVRWVATEKDWRRKGLARAVVIGALMAATHEGCHEARLRTETDRVAAIAMYLQLGFEPLVREAQEREVWDRVIRHLASN